MRVRKRTTTGGLLRLVAILAGGMWATHALADDGYDQCIELSDGTNVAWSECGGAYLARLDGEMDAAWQRVFSSLTQEGQKLIEAEQQAWTTFKDISCLYYENGEYGRGGQVLHFTICRGEIIERRIQYLVELIDFVTVGGE